MPVGRAAMSDVRFYGAHRSCPDGAHSPNSSKTQESATLALGDEAATADSCPHPQRPTVVPGERPVDVEIPAQTGLRESPSCSGCTAAGAAVRRADPHGLPAPAVLRPALTGFIDEDVRTEPADVPVTVRVSRRQRDSPWSTPTAPSRPRTCRAASSIRSPRWCHRWHRRRTPPVHRARGSPGRGARAGRANRSRRRSPDPRHPVQSHREERSPVRWPR